ncbi:MAG: SprT family zinc-dependent metalloprotease [Methylicorpusculum sp.]|nr:SprT family zinc-dependent metalloprotease [Methylicorpusculum sp.]
MLFNRVQVINTLPFPYQILRSKRARLVRLRVTSQQVEVIAPHGVSEQSIHRFVSEKQDWVLSTQERLKNRRENLRSLAPATYTHGALLPYRDRSYPLVIVPVKRKKITLEFTGHSIASVPHTLLEADLHEAIRSAFTRWLKLEAKRMVEQCVDKHAARYGLYPRSIKIKTQKSRWGSCGVYNDINLNWLLILAPPEVLEYVVVHELCHIKHRNHSSRFWELVAEHMPEYKTLRQWLKINGGHLLMGL